MTFTNTSYFNISKGLILSLFLLCNIFTFSQTNEKIKAKEEPQIKAISKTNKPTLEKKRQDYLTQTREQRLSVGKQKSKNKNIAKENKQNQKATTSTGKQKAQSKGEKETEYLTNTSAQRKFKGDDKKPKDNSKSLAKDIKNNAANVKTGTPQEREYKQVTSNKGATNFTGKTNNADSKYKEEGKKNMGQYSGDKKYLTRGEKEAVYLKNTGRMRGDQGNINSNKLAHIERQEENKQTMTKYATGDLKYQTKGQKEMDYLNKTKGLREHQGSIKTEKLAHIQRKEENKQTMSKYSTGDVKTNKLAHIEQKDANKKEMEGYQGNIKSGQFAHILKKEENKKEMEKYSSGDLKYMTKKQKDMAYLKRTKSIREFQGKVKIGNLAHLQKRDEIKADMEKFSTGDINLKDLDQRAKERRKRDKTVAAFSGSIRTKDLEKWGKSIRKREKEIANFQGNIKVEKRKKGQHPSAAYRGGKIANSYTQKEKMRKKMLKKHGRKGDVDMPAHLKDQPKKAKYNSDESEIWW